MIENPPSDGALERAVQRLNDDAAPAEKAEPEYKKEYLALLKRLQLRADGAAAGLDIIAALRAFLRAPASSPSSHLIAALEQTLYQMSLRSPLVTYQDTCDLEDLEKQQS